ncbi:hypothetical protein RRF57_011480 [Xylaria bambusicola]|uniref:Uncharacterized protein n=1 Tax=Xylaria bambusicola TaxID=326684 RepID=A0AAN7ZE51_9PEZI
MVGLPASEDAKVDPGEPPNIERFVFSFYPERVIKLVVGRRPFECARAHGFKIGPVVFFYVHSTQILCSSATISSNWRYEPVITAIMIAIAQGEECCTDEPVAVTRLLYTQHGHQQDMYVFTAHVSRLLLERFRYPNRAPSTYVPYLIKLQRTVVPYEPIETFRSRLLDALSVTEATIMDTDDFYDIRTRSLSHASSVVDSKDAHKRANDETRA